MLGARTSPAHKSGAHETASPWGCQRTGGRSARAPHTVLSCDGARMEFELAQARARNAAEHEHRSSSRSSGGASRCEPVHTVCATARTSNGNCLTCAPLITAKGRPTRRAKKKRKRRRWRPSWWSTVGNNCAAGGLFVWLLLAAGSAPLARAERMVRLCIASVDPAKLSSQCVMCNRREFPLTVIDCTGITKVNDLIAEPLSVQEAKCLIYNCRRVSIIISTGPKEPKGAQRSSPLAERQPIWRHMGPS